MKRSSQRSAELQRRGQPAKGLSVLGSGGADRLSQLLTQLHFVAREMRGRVRISGKRRADSIDAGGDNNSVRLNSNPSPDFATSFTRRRLGVKRERSRVFAAARCNYSSSSCLRFALKSFANCICTPGGTAS
jgi:hypothetical protein